MVRPVTAPKVWLGVGAYVVLSKGVQVAEGLEDVLCRVVGVDGQLRDIRRVGQTSGEPEGIAVRFLASELRPARVSLVHWYGALRLRAAHAGWRRAVEADDEDVDSLAILEEAAAYLADLVIDGDPLIPGELAVCDECGSATGELVSAEHARSCSLFPPELREG